MIVVRGLSVMSVVSGASPRQVVSVVVRAFPRRPMNDVVKGVSANPMDVERCFRDADSVAMNFRDHPGDLVRFLAYHITHPL
jgi:hypothetical protein